MPHARIDVETFPALPRKEDLQHIRYKTDDHDRWHDRWIGGMRKFNRKYWKPAAAGE